MTLADRVDWDKGAGLVPVIVQDADTALVLMLGYMNRAALEHTESSGLVTFYSRSKQRLWTKGESSGHVLKLAAIDLDCDQDTLLVQARPDGPTCHTGSATCFGEFPGPPMAFLGVLSQLVQQRHQQRPQGSYTTRLFEQGRRRIAQKVGEEGVETALAAVAQGPQELLGEAADLVFHLLVLLRDQDLGIEDVARVLGERHLHEGTRALHEGTRAPHEGTRARGHEGT